MSFKRLTTQAIRNILDALHPRFIGRDQDHLVALADETADDVYTQAQAYVQPLYDFRDDIESTAGAGLVGVNDAGGYYTGVTVEEVLQELPSKFLSSGSTYVSSFNGRSGAVTPALNDYTFAQIGSKPTTLAGYGITDAAPLSHVGSGGTAHANVVAGGAAGFMTGADKTKLDGIATGATANTGTVTSVAVANATGITWTGSPITTSGTLTPALSANLQSWSGIAPSTKADDSSVVHTTGNETITGIKTFNTSISSGASTVTNLNDVSRHYTAHTANGGYGIGVSANALNIVAGTSGGINFVTNSGTTAAANITSGGVFNYGGLEVGYRNIPRVTAGLDNGKMFATAAGVTVNTANAGDVYSVYNGSAAAITLTPGAGVTMRLAGTATTGARTLAQRGIATLWFNTTAEVIVTGNVT